MTLQMGIVLLQDPDHLGLDMIKTIHEQVEMDDYGSPTMDSVAKVSQWFQLERAFVEEVYWVLLGRRPSQGLSKTVNNMILKDFLCDLKMEDLRSVDTCSNGDESKALAKKLGVSVDLIQCVRDAIAADGASDLLSLHTMESIKLYIGQKEALKECQSFLQLNQSSAATVATGQETKLRDPKAPKTGVILSSEGTFSWQSAGLVILMFAFGICLMAHDNLVYSSSDLESSRTLYIMATGIKQSL